MTAIIGTCTQVAFRADRPLFFEQVLCDEAGRAIVWEWWRAYEAVTLRPSAFTEDRMLSPRQVVLDWRRHHGVESEREQLVFLFSSPDAESWYLAHLTAWALEDSDD